MRKEALIEKIEAMRTGLKADYQTGWDHGLSEAANIVRQHTDWQPIPKDTLSIAKGVIQEWKTGEDKTVPRYIALCLATAIVDTHRIRALTAEAGRKQ